MLDAYGGLLQQQALLRQGGEDTPTPRVLDEFVVITFRIEGEDGELQARLSRRLRVARSDVATGLAKDGEDVVGEGQLCGGSFRSVRWHGRINPRLLGIGTPHEDDAVVRSCINCFSIG